MEQKISDTAEGADGHRSVSFGMNNELSNELS